MRSINESVMRENLQERGARDHGPGPSAVSTLGPPARPGNVGIPRLGKSRNPRIPGVRTNSGIVGDAGRSFFGGHSTPRKKWIGVCHPVGLVPARSRVARRRAFLVEGDPRMLTTSEASPAAPATEADFAAARSLDW